MIETWGKGAGHNLSKNDIAWEHNISLLESNGSKMAEKLASTRPQYKLTVTYQQANDTLRSTMSVPRPTIKVKKVVQLLEISALSPKYLE